MQALLIETITPRNGLAGDMFVLSYLRSPLLAAAIGLALSAGAMKLFWLPEPPVEWMEQRHVA